MNLKLVPLLALALVLSACGGSAASSTMPAEPGAASSPASAEMSESSDTTSAEARPISGGAAEEAAQAPDTNASQQAFDRLVIKTADLSVTVPNVRAAETEIRTRAEALGGYVIESQSNGSDADLSVNISFRVPVTRFEEALSGVQGLAEKVHSSTVRGDDVTEEYVDLDSRRATLEATRDRLLELLSRANTVEETLQVNQTLTEIQSEIDQIEGRIKYLSQSAAMSTINVAIMPVPALQPLVTEEGWQPLAVAREALRGLVGFGQGLATVAIVLIVWSPVWGAVLLVFLFALRRLRGTGRRTAPPASTPSA